MMSSSLSRKLVLIFSTILIAVTALNIFISTFLLEKVYRSKKVKSMTEFYYKICSQYNSSDSDEEIVNTVNNMLTSATMRVYIWDESNNLIVDSFPMISDFEIPKDNAEDKQPLEEPREEPSDGTPFKKNHNFGGKDFRGELNIFFEEIPPENMVEETEDYSVIIFSGFGNDAQSNLYLRGYLPDDTKILIQTPVAAISEAVEISNTLMLAVGAVMLIIGIIIVLIASRTIVRPIKELSQIAVSMAQLDFSRKYSGNRKDEIGSLGTSINTLSENLESKINELYEKNEQLNKDIELKNRIDVMRKEFIANASHELKTPVALIAGYGEGLKDNVASDKETRDIYLDVILDEAEKMDHIIRQMLDLVELDSTNDVIDKKQFSLLALAEDAICTCDVLAKNKHITIKCEHSGTCTAYGDYWKLHQAVTNYLTNAIHHSDVKKPIVVNVHDGDKKTCFSVYNSGNNIPTEDMSQIWERFYKVDKARTREYGGTGLGLSIVRSIIELHGGEYGVINKEDGVEFYFTIPKEF